MTKLVPYLDGIARAPALLGQGAILFYQRVLSPLKPRTCRYYPTCSEYALRAIRHRGLIVGSALALWRLLRCNPFSPGGYDPGPWAHEEQKPGGATQ